MSFMKNFYPESQVLGFTRVDGTINFYNGVNSLLKKSDVALDIGCGRAEYQENKREYVRDLRILKGKCEKVIGIDFDPAGEHNPYLDDFRLIEGERWNIEDQSIDLAVADNVLEHVEDVDQFFSECNRVLKPGGHLCLRTPNKFSYFGLVTNLIPNSLHAKLTSKVQDDRKEEDVFPTVYKCNTRRAILRAFKKYGFEGAVYHFESEPAYFSFSKILYFFAVLHQKFAPDFMKLVLFGFAKKL